MKLKNLFTTPITRDLLTTPITRELLTTPVTLGGADPSVKGQPKDQIDVQPHWPRLSISAGLMPDWAQDYTESAGPGRSGRVPDTLHLVELCLVGQSGSDLGDAMELSGRTMRLVLACEPFRESPDGAVTPDQWVALRTWSQSLPPRARVHVHAEHHKGASLALGTAGALLMWLGDLPTWETAHRAAQQLCGTSVAADEAVAALMST